MEIRRCMGHCSRTALTNSEMARVSSTVHFCCISYREVILVTHQTEPENYTDIIHGILPLVPRIPGNGVRKFTYPIERFQVHMLIDNNGITYSCITESTDAHLLPFTFLDTVKTKFSRSTDLEERAPNAEENEFEREFAPVLAAIVYNFNAGQGNKLSHFENQVNDVKEIILSNVETFIERGEQLEALITKSENLTPSRTTLHENSRQLRRRRKCETWTMWFLISALLGALLTAAMLIASGVIRL